MRKEYVEQIIDGGVDDRKKKQVTIHDENYTNDNVSMGKSLKSGKTDATSNRPLPTSKKPYKSKEQRELEKRKSKLDYTTRWIADSSFTTYYGKPAFHTYGRANTKPTQGGINYGQNMLTHNINPECGKNPP